MSEFKVTAEKLVIHPHPNADALELAQVGLYRAVVRKGQYTTGDYALYIPEQAVVPDELLEELELTGKLAGSGHNRVKAVRLRGELSQGIVCSPAAAEGTDLAKAAEAGEDFADLLGITKFKPPIPTHMAGQVESGVDMLPWVDIQNIKRYPDVFSTEERVEITEKVHGTCCIATYYTSTGIMQVTSKGLGENKTALKMPDDTDKNLYWRTLTDLGARQVLRSIAILMDAEKVGLYGEVYGKGVQDLSYGIDDVTRQTPGFRVFDVCIERGAEKKWLSYGEIVSMMEVRPGEGLVLEVVPLLYRGPFSLDKVMELTTGKESVSGEEQHLREGVVVRAFPDRYSAELGGRAILKSISPDYLLRKGGTEYE